MNTRLVIFNITFLINGNALSPLIPRGVDNSRTPISRRNILSRLKKLQPRDTTFHDGLQTIFEDSLKQNKYQNYKITVKNVKHLPISMTKSHQVWQ